MSDQKGLICIPLLEASRMQRHRDPLDIGRMQNHPAVGPITSPDALRVQIPANISSDGWTPPATGRNDPQDRASSTTTGTSSQRHPTPSGAPHQRTRADATADDDPGSLDTPRSRASRNRRIFWARSLPEPTILLFEFQSESYPWRIDASRSRKFHANIGSASTDGSADTRSVNRLAAAFTSCMIALRSIIVNSPCW